MELEYFKQINLAEFVRDTVFLTISGVMTYIFLYLLLTDRVFQFKPGSGTVLAGLLIGILGLSFASRMYMEEVACAKP